MIADWECKEFTTNQAGPGVMAGIIICFGYV
jgi:hypothetical protein